MKGKCSAHFAWCLRHRDGDDHKIPTCATIQHRDKVRHMIENLCQRMKALARSAQQGVERAPEAQRGQHNQQVQHIAAKFFL